MSMKALSFLQPWASLIAIGAKKIEFRSWTTPYRGQLLIHAMKRKHPYLDILAQNPIVKQELAKAGLELSNLPMGSIIGKVDLTDIKPVQFEWINSLSDTELAFSERCKNGWFLSNAKCLSPVACSGKQGLWDFGE